MSFGKIKGLFKATNRQYKQQAPRKLIIPVNLYSIVKVSQCRLWARSRKRSSGSARHSPALMHSAAAVDGSSFLTHCWRSTDSNRRSRSKTDDDRRPRLGRSLK